ncbi:MAG TPA: hypothetical protein VK806_13055 [Bacteroidia bacterium]|jgi:hypothetical protein|nr:hypothetical protein [Bacteroidia bacterium]
MNTKQFLLTGILGIALAGTILTGCKKNNESPDTDTNAAQDEANATFAINDTKNTADGAVQGMKSNRPDHNMTGCATWTGDSSATTDSLIISFPGSCTSPDGRIRKGDIIVYWNKGTDYFDSGAVINMTFRNYSFTNRRGEVIGVTGTRTHTNLGRNMSGDQSWGVNANLTLTYATGGTATWTANRVHTLMHSTNFYYYSITGTASGTSKSGVAYNINITSPLIRAANWINSVLYSTSPCYCIEAGSLTVSRTGKKYPLYLTYTSGLGNCDYTAAATINGNTYDIIVP